MDQYAPFARIILRYGVGLAVGLNMGEELAADPDLVLAVAMLIGLGVEALYIHARRKGKAT